MYNGELLENSMQNLKAGNKSSFNIIYNQTYKLVFYTIYGILNDYHRSEDIMQEAFLKVYHKIDQYKPNTSPKAWIMTIARNLALNEYKKMKKEIFLDSDKALLISDEIKQTPLIDLAAKTLTEEEYMLVMLSVVERYKNRELAKMFNLSTSGISWKVNNALKKLKKEVEASEDEEIKK